MRGSVQESMLTRVIENVSDMRIFLLVFLLEGGQYLMILVKIMLLIISV